MAGKPHKGRDNRDVVSNFDAHFCLYSEDDISRIGAALRVMTEQKEGIFVCMIHDYRDLLDGEK